MVIESEQSMPPSISSQLAFVPHLEAAICCTCRTDEDGLGNIVMICQVTAAKIHAMKAVHALVSSFDVYALQYM